jgi:hypothetical protein
LGWGWGLGLAWGGWGWGPHPWWGPFDWGWGPRFHRDFGFGRRGWAGTTGNVYARWDRAHLVGRAPTRVEAWGGGLRGAHVGVAYNSHTGMIQSGQRAPVRNVYTYNRAGITRTSIPRGGALNGRVGEPGAAPGRGVPRAIERSAGPCVRATMSSPLPEAKCSEDRRRGASSSASATAGSAPSPRRAPCSTTSPRRVRPARSAPRPSVRWAAFVAATLPAAAFLRAALAGAPDASLSLYAGSRARA